MFNDGIYTIEREVKERFYKPSVSSVKAYQSRVTKAWNDKGASIKRCSTLFSVLFAVGLVALKCQYV